MKLFKYLSLFRWFCLALSSCGTGWDQPVPDTELVYESRLSTKSNQLGFVNTDGVDPLLIELTAQFYKPVWSNDGLLLYGLTDTISPMFGYPAYWNTRNGSFKVCKRGLPYFSQIEDADVMSDKKEVLISNVNTILRMNLDTCKYTTVLELNLGRMELRGFSYHSDSQELIYGVSISPDVNPVYQIRKFNLETGEVRKFGNGVFPSWSPDGSQIAYIWMDGIYLMDANGEEAIHIYNFTYYEFRERAFPETLPKLRWSPDGEWIVFHDCSTEFDCKGEFDIYKVSTSGDYPVVFVSPGYNPSWKP